MNTRIIKIAKCGKLTAPNTISLTYNIGVADSGKLHFRTTDNSTGGLFSPEWIALDTILDTVKTAPEGTTRHQTGPLLDFLGLTIATPLAEFGAREKRTVSYFTLIMFTPKKLVITKLAKFGCTHSFQHFVEVGGVAFFSTFFASDLSQKGEILTIMET